MNWRCWASAAWRAIGMPGASCAGRSGKSSPTATALRGAVERLATVSGHECGCGDTLVSEQTGQGTSVVDEEALASLAFAVAASFGSDPPEARAEAIDALAALSIAAGMLDGLVAASERDGRTGADWSPRGPGGAWPARLGRPSRDERPLVFTTSTRGRRAWWRPSRPAWLACRWSARQGFARWRLATWWFAARAARP